MLKTTTTLYVAGPRNDIVAYCLEAQTHARECDETYSCEILHDSAGLRAVKVSSQARGDTCAVAHLVRDDRVVSSDIYTLIEQQVDCYPVSVEILKGAKTLFLNDDLFLDDGCAVRASRRRQLALSLWEGAVYSKFGVELACDS